MNASAARGRLRVEARGLVQGVGFRPHVHRLAEALALSGWVRNTGAGVEIEVEGARAALEQFLLRLAGELPPGARLESLEPTWLEPAGHARFEILPSAAGAPRAGIRPDVATCAECLRELFDPRDRRFRHPFVNCTSCGPRLSIVTALPYDRPNTTMARFEMCARCRREYEDPRDRRFHAQPNACPDCGPRLAWQRGAERAEGNEALGRAVELIRAGGIAAVKGLGGFHLFADARDESAVRRLRERKAREEKPFAAMFPDLEALRAHASVAPLEARLLASPEAPIVLLRRSRHSALAPSVAPGNPCLGALLPYTPLHHLLLRALNMPVVATSGNVSDEPLCVENAEALERLGGIADGFLLHDRPIARAVDDSIARIALGRELILRRARGYAPWPIALPEPGPAVLAAGGHLKSTVALAVEGEAIISQHLGDLESPAAREGFERAARDYGGLYGAAQAVLACDAHPDYASTRWTLSRPERRVEVQHHYAHVLACMVENRLAPPVLGVAWDGAGYGSDGTVWGGEFLLISEHEFERSAHLRTFPLPGGESASREGWRAALGLLYERFGDGLFELHAELLKPLLQDADARVLRRMLDRGLNCPRTSSVGRLFDAVAALAGLRRRSSFEGQAAQALEFALDPATVENGYTLALRPGAEFGSRSAWVLDWAPLLDALLEDLARGAAAGAVSARFHDALARAAAETAERLGAERIALSGGCFQNAALLERAVAALEGLGRKAYTHQRVPPNDGGLALGQLVAARRVLKRTD
ncbi:MAG: carbamoyltransferase HypF [Planctomycetota bacterium]|nr:carbamoyltransferase HypF [Planctomycetota bacterium]